MVSGSDDKEPCLRCVFGAGPTNAEPIFASGQDVDMAGS